MPVVQPVLETVTNTYIYILETKKVFFFLFYNRERGGEGAERDRETETDRLEDRQAETDREPKKHRQIDI